MSEVTVLRRGVLGRLRLRLRLGRSKLRKPEDLTDTSEKDTNNAPQADLQFLQEVARYQPTNSKPSYTDAQREEALRSLAAPTALPWDPLRTCLEGTRQQCIEEISSWLTTRDGAAPSAEILMIADIGGSGKSAVLHSVCQKAHEQGHLLASFFFAASDRQSTSANLIAGILEGICNLDGQVQRRIAELIIEDTTLTDSASIIRQFEGLILPICSILPTDRQFVIAIDALDEALLANDHIIINVLRDYIPRLPPSFRILLTTRPERRIMVELTSQPHVHRFLHPLAGASSLKDVETFIRHRLSNTLIPDSLLEQFVAKTEGLFFCASSVLDQVHDAVDPVSALEDILLGPGFQSKCEVLPSKSPPNTSRPRIYRRSKWTDPMTMEASTTIPILLEATRLWRDLERKHPGNYQHDVASSAQECATYLMGAGRHSEALTFSREAVRKYRSLSISEPDKYDVEFAAALYTLAQIYGFSNSWSLTTIEEAIAIRRRLAEKDPVTFDPDLASSLYEYTSYLTHFHRGADAVAPAQEALEIYRRLATVEPAKYEIKLAQALVELGYALNACQRSQEAIVITREATDMWRRIVAEDRSPLNLRILGISINNQAAFLVSLGDKGAVIPGEEAVSLRRELVKMGPKKDAKDEKDLATSMQNLCACFVLCGRYEDAISLIQETIEIRRRLHETDWTMIGDLAFSVSSHAQYLTDKGSHDEAIVIRQEEIDFHRKLAEEDPARYDDSLARTLANLGHNLNSCGRTAEAMPLTTEAIEVSRRAIARDPTNLAFQSTLAWSLNNYGVYLANLKRNGEATQIIEEAVSIRRHLAIENPEKFEGDLAWSLQDRGWVASLAERYEEALVSVYEAVEIRRRLAGTDPITHNSSLSLSLTNCNVYLSAAGRHQEALAYGEEAVNIRRQLAEDDPGRYESDLAWSLQEHAWGLTCCERPQDSLVLFEEAVAIRRRLPPTEANRSNLALSLIHYAKQLATCDRQDESIDPGRESVAIRRQLVAENPQKYEADLAFVLQELSWCFREGKRFDDGLPLVTEALKIRRRLFSEDPKIEGELAESVFALAFDLSKLGKHDEALELAQEAVTIYRRMTNEQPGKDEIDVSNSLALHARCLNSKKRYEEAVNIALEGLDVYPHSATKDLGGFYESVEAALHVEHAEGLSQIGRGREAHTAIQVAIGIFSKLMDSETTRFRSYYKDELEAAARLQERISVD
ncbi:TPR-like protein [Coprinopsis marcescibilis]|uniref:TPR-like protein n=1 Tax=Coprinopsis marcescibilis TaxID=230819 RepID=A0A5C3LA75_COPMA|nr:TPR-like protein [Coprinopsis marcescibilis]